MTLKSQGRKQIGRQEGNRGTQSKGISFVASRVGDVSLQRGSNMKKNEKFLGQKQRGMKGNKK